MGSPIQEDERAQQDPAPAIMRDRGRVAVVRPTECLAADPPTVAILLLYSRTPTGTHRHPSLDLFPGSLVKNGNVTIEA
jgi:hypothetical protein